MPAYTDVVTNFNTVVEIVALPVGSRTRTSYTFTADGGGSAIAQGSTSIDLDPVSPVALYAGDTLTFGSVTVTLTADAAAGASSLTVAATSGSIADNVTATTFAMRKLTGADTASISFSSESVDASGFGDGITKEMVKVAAGWSVDCSGTYTQNAAVEEVLFPLGSNGDDATKEAYLVITYGDGTIDQGVCQVLNYSESVALRDVKKFSATLEGRAELTRTFPA